MEKIIINAVYPASHDKLINSTTGAFSDYGEVVPTYVFFEREEKPESGEMFEILSNFEEFRYAERVIITDNALIAFVVDPCTYVYKIFSKENINLDDIAFDSSPLDSYKDNEGFELSYFKIPYNVDSTNRVSFRYSVKYISGGNKYIEIPVEILSDGNYPQNNGLFKVELSSNEITSIGFAYRQIFKITDISNSLESVTACGKTVDFSEDGEAILDLSNYDDVPIVYMTFTGNTETTNGFIEVV